MSVVRALFSVLVAAIATSSSPVCAQCEWRVGPHQAEPGLSGKVLAQAFWDPDGAGPQVTALVVGGGSITRAGLDTASNIAAYDGTEWRTLGAGVSGGEVSALAVFNGELVAAGTFTAAGGQPVGRIARYNGTAWLPLGLGMDGPVNALAVHNGSLYAAGTFGTAGGAIVNKIARWDGAAWAPVGGGFPGALEVPRAMASFDGGLWVGGTLSSAGGVSVSNLARWTGSAWQAAGNPNGTVNAMAVRSTTTVGTSYLYVGGAFSSIGGISAGYIARYNSIASPQWSTVGIGLPDPCVSLLIRSTGLTSFEVAAVVGTGGAPLAQQVLLFSGGVWNAVGAFATASPGPVADWITFYGGRYHIGMTGSSGGSVIGCVRAWDGAEWYPVGLGLSGPVHALQPFGGDLVFAGDFTYASNQRVNRIARWNGTGWTPMDNGMNGAVRALAVFNGQLWAAGNFTVAGSVATNNVARWNGTAWEGAGFQSAAGANGPRALADFNGQLVVAGDLGSGVLFRSWNGTGWTNMPTTGLNPSPGAYPRTLAAVGSNLYAGGSGLIGSSLERSAIAVFRPSLNSWGEIMAPSGAGNGHSVNRLLAFNNILYATGAALSIGPSGQGYPLAEVSSTSFSAVNALVDTFNVSPGYVLEVYNGELYAGGGFNQVSGQPAPTALARRGPSSGWVPAGNGMDVLPLTGASAVYQGELVMAVGSSFSGTPVGSRWVRWYCAAPCYANCDGSTIAPILNVNDFICFQTKYAAGDPAANCDGSTIVPVLNVNDFICFQTRYAAGCP